MPDITVRTDHKYKDVIYWEQLTPKEQKEFDWIASSDTLTTDEAEFIRYRDWVYCLNDVMALTHNAPDEFNGWDGYESDTYFSGVLFKYDPEDSSRVMCGTYYS